MAKLLLQLLLGVAIPAAVAWLTAWFSFGRFQQERWWQLKYEAYSGMMIALNRMKRVCGKEACFDLRNQEPSSAQQAEWTAEFEEARAHLYRNADLGDFLLSQGTCNALRIYGDALVAASGHDQSHAEHLQGVISAIDKLVGELKGEASRDLGVKKTPRDPS